MVIEKKAKTDTEIISVSDLLPSTPAAAPMAAAPEPGSMQQIEGWIKGLDKAISLADRGVTMLGKVDHTVSNITSALKQRAAMQQPQQQQVIYQPPAQQVQQDPPAPCSKVPVVISGKQVSLSPDEISGVIAELQNEMQKPPITSEQISGILGILLKQKSDMTVEEMKGLVDQYPGELNRLISVGASGILPGQS